MSENNLTPLSASKIKEGSVLLMELLGNVSYESPRSKVMTELVRGWICHLIFELLGDPKAQS